MKSPERRTMKFTQRHFFLVSVYALALAGLAYLCIRSGGVPVRFATSAG